MMAFLNKKAVYLIPVLLVCAFPIMFLFLNNVGEVWPHEIVNPLLLFLSGGMLCCLIAASLTKSLLKGCLCSIITCFFLYNYALFEMVLKIIVKRGRYWHFAPCYVVFIIIVAYILCKMNDKLIQTILQVITLIMAALFLINFVTAVPEMIKSFSEGSHREDAFVSSETADDMLPKPNVYYFIFDEYSAFDILEKYYDYDNFPFAEFLEERGFTVSYNGMNDSQQSHTVISNYVNLDYIALDSDTRNERSDMMRTGRMFDIVRQNGYTVNGVSSGAMFGLEEDSPLVSTTMSGESFADLVYKNTIFYPMLSENTYEKCKEVIEKFDLFKKEEFYSTYPNSTFQMVYFALPHQPFVFDADGNDVPLAHINDWENKEFYLNQLIFTTKCIEETVNNILEHDPDSVIILQSDHSARSLQDAEGNYLIEKHDRRHFLNAVYYRGESIEEIIDKSGVNTLRIVFNRLLDLDLPELEVPDSEYEF